jgi:hypothetical protein
MENNHGNWAVSKKVISYDRLKWAVNLFLTYKSLGMDGIMPMMLQQGFELLGCKLVMLLRASLALGYIPMSWRHVRVVFIPTPGKSFSQAKSLRPVSLMSFILKILEKLLDRHIRGGVLVKKPLHRYQFACRAGMSTETALSRSIRDWKSLLNTKRLDWVSSWTLRAHSTIPLLTQWSSLPGGVDLKRLVSGGLGPYTSADSYILFLLAAV